MDLYASLMRTLVPIVAGLLLSLAAQVGWDLDDPAVTTAVTALLGAAYYAVFRLAEEWAAWIGWRPAWKAAGVMLGWARPPRYSGGGDGR